MKNPDSVDDSIERAIESEVLDRIEGQTPDEVAEMKEDISNEIRNACKKWVEYEEYVRIEIDTIKNTAKVLEA
jgi:gas vesicle protein